MSDVKLGSRIDQILASLNREGDLTYASSSLEIRKFDIDGDGVADFEHVRRLDHFGMDEFIRLDARGREMEKLLIDRDGYAKYREATTFDDATGARTIVEEADTDRDGVAEFRRTTVWNARLNGHRGTVTERDADRDGTMDERKVEPAKTLQVIFDEVAKLNNR